MGKDTNTISLSTAQDWAKRWRDNSELKAFWIPKEDIDQMRDHQGSTDLRAYLGIDDEGEAKLMIVAVIDNEDMIDDTQAFYIYDFTKPCPTMCDIKSGLYNLP